MEANQRRYTRNLSTQIQISPKETMTKEQIRRALIERRTIIGPNGEKFEIPKHMSLDDMINYFKSEFKLTHAEVTQVLAAAEMLTRRPDYRGKLNRIVMDGAENPLRIEIPKDRPKAKQIPAIQETVVKKEEPRVEVSTQNPSRDVDSKTHYDDNIILFDMPRRQSYVPRANSYTVPNPNTVQRNEIQVNAIVADRMRAGRAEQRRLEQERAEQSRNLEKQMRAHYQEQARRANRNRKNRLALVAALGFLWVTGLIVDVVGLTREVTTPGENLEPIGIHADAGELFDVTPQTISNFTGDINLIPTDQKTNNYGTVTTLDGYQPFEYSIDTVSQGLKQNSNLANVLNNFSNTAENPITVGEIASYQEFEQLLANGDEALYTSGPAYFANFSRQMVHGMLKDKYGAERVKATYEKTGENNQNYEFYIRYFKSGSSSERTPEGRVTMTRNAEGRLQTNEYHTLPYEVYELLAMIGEFSDFTNNPNGLPFDIEGYAEKYTNGDIQRAREELKDRMTYGTDAIRTLLKNRVRDDNVDYYRYDR